MRALCKWGVVAMGVLAFSVSARGLEPGGIAGLRTIPQDDLGDIHYITTGGDVGGRWDCEAPTPVYLNDDTDGPYMYLRVPDSVGGPGTLWLADDMFMDFPPNGADPMDPPPYDQWDICGYHYMTYGFGGSAPYVIDSALYRFDACTSMPTPLVDWYTGDCCVTPQEIPDTHATADIPVAGMVEVCNCLPNQPVTVDRYIFMHLSYSGANVAGNAGWIIAYTAEVGFTDDFWVEDIDGIGCGLFWFGGDPYAGFMAQICGESRVVFENVPVGPVEPLYCGGNEMILDCNDLPVCVQVEVYARDWDLTPDLGVCVIPGPPDTWTYIPCSVALQDCPAGMGYQCWVAPQAKGFQTTINCASYNTATTGTLTPISDDCSPGIFPPCEYCTMGINKMHKDAGGASDYIFWMMGDNAACNSVNLCPDGKPGWYSCLSGAANTYTDPGVPQYMNHYAFIVSADTTGTWEVSLDPRTLYTQLGDPNAMPILPLARIPALLTIETGMCCYNIAAGTADCTDGVTTCYCDDLDPNPATHFWNVDEYCPPPPESCCQCVTDMDCFDLDACTVDTCDNCICYHTAVVVTVDECCDDDPINQAADVAGAGAIVSNLDPYWGGLDDPCTQNLCNPGGGCAVAPQCGVPINPPCTARCCELQTDNPAKAVACTYDDTCNYYCMGVDGMIQPLVECGGEPPGFCEAFEPMAVCEWGCHGIDVNTYSCVTDDDCHFTDSTDPYWNGHDMGVGAPCVGQSFPCKAGKCYCAETTRLWIDVEDDDCCFFPSTTFPVHVKKTAGADTVTGAQFVVYYDPDCVDFVSAALGADFSLLLYQLVDEEVGMVFMAVGIQPFTGSGTAGPATLATLFFHCKAACIHCEICLGQAVNPPNTVLTNDLGEEVTMISWGCSDNGDECVIDADCNEGANCGCSCHIVQLGDDGIVVPDDVITNSDCEKTTAMVTWDTPPYYWNECEGHSGVDLAGPDGVWGTMDDMCYGIHDVIPGQPEDQMSDEYIMGLIEGGGEFAQGKTTFCCEGPPCHLCDVPPVAECWTVDVTDQNAMDVIVQYSPEMTMGPYVRCIYFWLFMDCYHDPILVMVDMVFGPPFDFVGKSTAILKVPKAQYDCVAAKDPLHTLRSTDGPPILCVDNKLVVAFHGDPLLGGNWLINGNLNCDNHIDILDFGLFLFQYMMLVPVDTPCGTAMPHADFNGDGIVNSADFIFIFDNFLEESKDACCDDPTSGWQGDPTLSITVKELRRRGMADLAIADLNGDGVLDMNDMTAFQQGNVPVRPERIKRTGVRSIGH